MARPHGRRDQRILRERGGDGLAVTAPTCHDPEPGRSGDGGEEFLQALSAKGGLGKPQYEVGPIVVQGAGEAMEQAGLGLSRRVNTSFRRRHSAYPMRSTYFSASKRRFGAQPASDYAPVLVLLVDPGNARDIPVT